MERHPTLTMTVTPTRASAIPVVAVARFVAGLSVAILGLTLLGTPAVAQALPDEEADRRHLESLPQRDRVDEAIDKALVWLVAQQDVQKGSFASSMSNTYTALACMALMAAGQQDGRTQYGEALRKGLVFLAAQGEAANGYLGKDGGRMYGHGICTLALCEGYGMLARPEDNRRLLETIRKAVNVILDSQATAGPHAGGWRYEPRPADADLSVTAWQILALRSAQNCGIEVPEAAMAKAAEYVRRCHNGNQFCYQGGGGGSPAMAAAGVVSMKAMGADKDAKDMQQIEASGRAFTAANCAGGSHYWYQSYYLATAANVLGDQSRRDYLPKVEEAILRLQQPDGQFAQHGDHAGGVYSTSFAVVCLAVRYQYLPIYQE